MSNNHAKDTSQRQALHTLFAKGQYLELYQSVPHIINEILSIDSQKAFEDFIKSEGGLDERVFWLHYGAWNNESLLIGAYEEDVTYTVRNFLSAKLPESLFDMLDECLQDIYVDIDEEDNLCQVVVQCNQYLEYTGYKLHLEFEDTYYAGAYFLSVVES